MATHPADLPLELAHRIDEVCDRFEAGWRAGQRPRLEDYLDVGDTEARRALLRELLAAEVESRLRFGERPAPGEYSDRFPGDGPVVDAVFKGLGLTDTVPADEPDRPAPPAVPGFEILGELGRGGMGV